MSFCGHSSSSVALSKFMSNTQIANCSKSYDPLLADYIEVEVYINHININLRLRFDIFPGLFLYLQWKKSSTKSFSLLTQFVHTTYSSYCPNIRQTFPIKLLHFNQKQCEGRDLRLLGSIENTQAKKKH